MDGELPAVPLVAVCDREAHHRGARFEVRHASAQPVVDRAGTDVEAPGDLLLAYPSAPRGITWMSWVAAQGGSRGTPQLPDRDGNQASVVQAHWKDRRRWFAPGCVWRTLAVICHRKSRAFKNPNKRWWRRRELKPRFRFRDSARKRGKNPYSLGEMRFQSLGISRRKSHRSARKCKNSVINCHQ